MLLYLQVNRLIYNPILKAFSVFFLVFITSCNTGKLNLLVSICNDLEASAIEIVKGSNLIWVIEDGGNKNS